MMQRRSILYLVAAAVVAGACASPATPSVSKSAAPSEAPAESPDRSPAQSPALSPGSGVAMALRVAPADLGCDAMPVDYRKVTFVVDPSATDAVTAQTETGKSLQTFWSVGFQGVADERAVKDPSGQVVAANGETLDIPEGALPRLHGYFVCPSPNALYVLLQDPT